MCLLGTLANTYSSKHYDKMLTILPVMYSAVSVYPLTQLVEQVSDKQRGSGSSSVLSTFANNDNPDDIISH